MTALEHDFVSPHTESFYQDPYPTYALLRDEAPVYEIPETPGLFFVTTWPLVKAALMDPGLFSSVMPPKRRTEPPAEVAEEVAALRAQGYPYLPALGTNDPPAHTRYRKMVNRSFTTRTLGWMEPLVDEVSDTLVSQLPDDEVIDLMESLTIPLPVWAIMRILGLPDEHRDNLRRWSDSANASLGGVLSAERWLETERDSLEFQTVMSAELDQRRAQSTDDLLSLLVSAEEGETPLTNGELIWLVRELVVAGNETTIRALADIIVYLVTMGVDENGVNVWDRLRTDETFRRNVSEEGIRMASPVMGLWRRVTRDTEFGGVHLPAESTVFLAFSSANRDDDVFDSPDDFDPLRKNVREHLAFGHGIHVCVGAGLARIEIASALRALGEQVASIEIVDRDALRYGPSYGLRGLLGLPARVHRRQSA